LKNKYSQKCLDNYEGENNLESKLAYFGDEIGRKCWNKKEQNMLILVDGFICSVAFLIALKRNHLL
jgi:nicotinate-nucleotide--dimethylbenzimidazole phosphoribosyltransferase